MSGREWKPGDVAMVSNGRSEWAAARDSKGWSSLDPDIGYAGDFDVTRVRPLVVIDPEDREQVERLARVAHESQFVAEWRHLHESTRKAQTDATQAALRSLITPPKPDEPTGLGAVVEDAEDRLYVNVGTAKHRWRHGSVAYDWRDIAAVRVLSEGVTP